MRDDPSRRTYESRRLRTSLRFSTYSDAKLAGLFLDNDFPVVLFKKVFDVILDPDFKPEDVTFEDVWDMFTYISGRRKKDALKRELAPAVTISDEEDKKAELAQIRTNPGVIPPLVLDLVVDRLIKARMPLGVATSDPWWASAFQSNIEPFYSMSLVHRSWTTIAQRGLRRRVVIPYQHINRFLLSPFCGPWITEMIIYWSVENGSIGVTKGDIWLLEALLDRTPNLRSLSFNTSLVWLKDFPQPSFDVNICLEIISDLLPDLENLWLKHMPAPVSSTEECLDTCIEMRSLCRQLPKLRSLRLLSISSWGSAVDEEGSSSNELDLDWSEHPPSHLKAIELSHCEGVQREDLKWLLKPRSEFRLESLSLTTRVDYQKEASHSVLREALLDSAHEIKALRLCIVGASGGSVRRSEVGQFTPFYTDSLLSCSKLLRLDIIVVDDATFNWNSILLPPSIEHLAIHLHDDFLQKCLLPPLASQTPTSFVQVITKILSTVPRLQTLLISGSQDMTGETVRYLDLDNFLNHINADVTPSQNSVAECLSAVCEKRGVRLVLTSHATPYYRWDVLQEPG
ncbi:hypothetical protein ACEPAF_9121 [Sanghuangporus sanghuang]